MNLLDLTLLSVALAMDCFAISIISGVFLRSICWKTILRISFLFGIFQGLMPVGGWIGIHYFSNYIQTFDHWIAFALLTFIGGRMIKEHFSEEQESHFNPTDTKTQFTLAIATSIDALAIGITFSCVGYSSIQSLLVPVSIIGAGSFLFSLAGCLLGITLGEKIREKLRPELIGGIILILIGIKVLVSHLLEV